MKLEDTSLTTEKTKEEETRFTPEVEALLKTSAGEIGTPEQQVEAQKKLAEMLSGPISHNYKL